VDPEQDLERRRLPAQEILVHNGKTLLTLDQLAQLQPGMDRLMAQISERTRALYFAASAEAWDAADYFSRTLGKQLKQSTVSRPKYTEAMGQFLEHDYAPVRKAILDRDLGAFHHAWGHLVDRVNHWHRELKVGYLVYRTPTDPPPDLDFTQR
jgi:hypothetical protein